jgi:hypothetical protein
MATATGLYVGTGAQISVTTGLTTIKSLRIVKHAAAPAQSLMAFTMDEVQTHLGADKYYSVGVFSAGLKLNYPVAGTFTVTAAAAAWYTAGVNFFWEAFS